MDGAQEKVVFVEFLNGSKFQNSIMTNMWIQWIIRVWLVGREGGVCVCGVHLI